MKIIDTIYLFSYNDFKLRYFDKCSMTKKELFMDSNLQELGFNKKEEALYLALLELGQAAVSEIAQRAGVNRATCYVILNSLLRKGFATEAAKRGRKYFVAAPPDYLAQYAEAQSKKWRERAESARHIVVELSKRYKGSGSRPVVKYYEGVEGIKAVYEDSLMAKDMIRSYSDVSELKDLMQDYAERYFKRRTKKRIYIRTIMKLSDYAIHLKRVGSQFLREGYLVPADKFDFTLEKYVYNDKVAFISFRDRFGVIIESKDIAQSEKYLYELAWQAAKEYDREVERKLKNPAYAGDTSTNSV